MAFSEYISCGNRPSFYWFSLFVYFVEFQYRTICLLVEILEVLKTLANGREIDVDDEIVTCQSIDELDKLDTRLSSGAVRKNLVSFSIFYSNIFMAHHQSGGLNIPFSVTQWDFKIRNIHQGRAFCDLVKKISNFSYFIRFRF